MPRIPIRSPSTNARPSVKLDRKKANGPLTKLLSLVPDDHLSKLKDIIDVGWKLALIAGMAWSGAYYAFIANVLPNINLSALPAVLVSTFVVGAIVTTLFLSIFFFPGLFVRINYPKEYGENQLEALKLFYAGFFSTLGFITFLLISLNLLSGHLIQKVIPPIVISSIVFLFGMSWLLIKAISQYELRMLREISMLEFKRPALYVATGAWLSPTLIALMAGSLLESSPDYAPLAFYGFAVVTLLAVLSNYFLSLPQRRSLFASIIFLSLMLILVLSEFTPSNRPNLFLTVPYRILKIGQVHARLTLDKNFEQQSSMFTECHPKKTAPQTYNLFVIDSIGSEYIIECIEQNKRKLVVKIPKKAVIQAMYGD